MHTHLYWLAVKDTDEGPSGRRGASALSEIKVKMKTEMCKSQNWGVP
jgi:hypothetical protein